MNAAQRTHTDVALSFLHATDPRHANPERIGAKAAGLVLMANAGLPVRPGFVLGTATSASFGVAVGQIALDVTTARRRGEHGEPVILVRPEASTEDIAGLAVCRGLLTARGVRTSHAAVVARQLGVVCLVNCPGLAVDLATRTLRIGDHELNEGDVITLDAGQGSIYAGALAVVDERPDDLIAQVRGWRNFGV